MLVITPGERDDPAFTDAVARMLNRLVASHRPDDVYVVQIDNWFDYKRLNFAGTLEVQLGIWEEATLRVPPFRPNRVKRQLLFRRDAATGTYGEAPSRPLHLNHASHVNVQRVLHRISPRGVFVWYGGGTGREDHASLMAYTTGPDGESGWYAGFLRRGMWSIDKTNGISRQEAASMLSAPPIGFDAPQQH